MRVNTTTTISAPVEQVWTVLADVRHWSDWTASIESVEAIDAGPMATGSRFRVRQPKSPAAVWEVTEFVPERSFTWATHRPGVHVVAGHELNPSEGGTRADLSLRITGPLAWLVSALAGRRTRRWVRMETDGLRRASEQAQRR